LIQGHYNLGAFLLQQGHPDQALPELEATISLDPRFPSGEATLAGDYSMLGKNSEALEHWRKAIALTPKSATVYVGAARILSSAAEDSLRNGTEAIGLAKQANDLTSGNDPSVLDTLGAAYAEAGQFPQALDSARRALGLAVAKGDNSMANGIRYRISLYEQNKPFRN
jgi:tetratricopeptide (TPR) repeat protein